MGRWGAGERCDQRLDDVEDLDCSTTEGVGWGDARTRGNIISDMFALLERVGIWGIRRATHISRPWAHLHDTSYEIHSGRLLHFVLCPRRA